MNYKLPEKRDHEILAKCEKLEGLDLTKKDKVFVKLIKTQLEDDWRRPAELKRVLPLCSGRLKVIAISDNHRAG